MKKIFYVVCFLIFALPGKTQESKVDKTLQTLYSRVLVPSDEFVDESVLYKPANQDYALKVLGGWFADTVDNVRGSALTFYFKIGQRTADTTLRRQVVSRLAFSCCDKNVGNANLAITYLTHFSRSDFANNVQDSLVHYLSTGRQSSVKGLIKLVGYLHIANAGSVLQKLVASAQLEEAAIWSTQIALARLGDERSAKICALVAAGTPVNNMYVSNILSDLIYTHHQYVYDALIAQINKNETGCASPNPYYNGQIPCAYRIIEALCGNIEGYPLKVNRGGDLTTNDYPAALKQVREWFTKNTTYHIIDSTY